MKAQIYAIRRTDEAKQDKAAVLEKHGSRKPLNTARKKTAKKKTVKKKTIKKKTVKKNSIRKKAARKSAVKKRTQENSD